MSDRPSSQHVPVLAREVIEWLRPLPGQILVDGTLGAGGHTRLLAAAVGSRGLVVALDRDPVAIARAQADFVELPIRPIHANYADLPELLAAEGLKAVDGIVLDLGLSSDQLGDDERGFSFQSTGSLDLRFDPTRGEPAWKLLERLSAKHLADLIYQYGEERYSRRIAQAVVERRRQQPIRTAADLAALLQRCVPRSRGHNIDPATRTFQALRIAVNDELKWLQTALQRLPDCLRPGGRLAVISFHSLEDRPVKLAFREDDRWNVLTRRPVRPSAAEISANPRARSAKLRVAERREYE
jgi:16S rRNA (cytosine1402-N4)-methyltransferase